MKLNEEHLCLHVSLNLWQNRRAEKKLLLSQFTSPHFLVNIQLTQISLCRDLRPKLKISLPHSSLTRSQLIKSHSSQKNSRTQHQYITIPYLISHCQQKPRQSPHASSNYPRNNANKLLHSPTFAHIPR